MAETGQMQGLLTQFRDAYRSRLRELDEKDMSSAERLKMKERILQSYNNDLSDQNETLVLTVQDLEKQANERVAALDSRLQRSATKIKDLDMDLRATQRDRDKLYNSCKDLQVRVDRADRHNGRLRDEVADYKYDMNTLVNTINTATSTGRWDLDTVKLRMVDAHKVFQGASGRRGPGGVGGTSNTAALETHVAELKEQIRKRDSTIDKLQADLRDMHEEARRTSQKMHEQEHARSTVEGSLNHSLKREQAVGSDAAKKDLAITRLQEDINQAQATIDTLRTECGRKDRRVQDLEAEVMELTTDLTTVESERSNHKHALQVAQDKARNYQSQLNEYEDSIHRLKADLARAQEAVSADLSRSTNDTNTGWYEKRIRQLEDELVNIKAEKRRHVEELDEMQQRLRTGSVSVKEHHDDLKVELERRDDTVQKLRRDVLKLQEQRDTFQSQLDTYDDKIMELEKELQLSDTEIQKRDSKVRELERELGDATRKHESARNEVQKLTVSLQQLQTTSKESRDRLSTEVDSRHSELARCKNEVREIEKKYQETLLKLNHRGENINQLKEEVKQANIRAGEAQDRCLVLDHELQRTRDTCRELSQKKDRLQTKLQEQELAWSQLEMEQRADLADRDEQISKFTADIRVLEERLSSSTQQLSQREEQVRELQSQIKDSKDLVDSRDKLIDKLQQDLEDSKDETRVATNELECCELQLQQVRREAENVRAQWQQLVQENGQLQAKVQTFMMDAQSEQDMLTSAVKDREQAMQELKMRNMQQQEQLAAATQENGRLKCGVEQLGHQLERAQSDLKSQQESATQLEQSLSRERERYGELSHKYSGQEEDLRETHLKYTSAEARCDEMEHNLEVKADLIQQLKADSESLQQLQREYIAKLSNKDKMIHNLNIDVGRLKNLDQEGNSKCNRMNDTIRKLQDTLADCKKDLEETRDRLENKVYEQGEAIRSLTDDLDELNTKYKDACNELESAQRDVEQQSMDNNVLTTKLDDAQSELRQMDETIREKEYDLAVTQERLKTAEQEMTNRDECIIRLTSDVDRFMQTVNDLREECGIKEQEREHTVFKYTALKQEHLELRTERDQIEALLRQEKDAVSKKSQDFHINMQELRNKEQMVEKVQADLTLTKGSHADEVRGLKQDIQILTDDLELANNERDEAQTEAAGHKARADQLTDTLEEERERLDNLQAQLERQRAELEDAGRLLTECRNRNICLEGELHTSSAKHDSMQNNLDNYMTKYQDSTVHIGNLEETINNLNEQLQRASDRETDLDEEVKVLHDTKLLLEAKMVDKAEQIKRHESVIAELTDCASELREENENLLKKISSMERKMHGMQEEIHRLSHELQMSEDSRKQVSYDFDRYKQHHSFTNEAMSELKTALSNAEYSLEDKKADITVKERQIKEFHNSVEALQAEVAIMKRERDQALHDVEQQSQAVQQLQLNLAAAHQKHLKEQSRREDQIHHLKADLEATTSHESNLENEVERLKEELGRAQGELRLALDDVQRKTSELDDLESKVKDVRHQLASQEEQNRQAENSITQLQSENAHLKAEVAQERENAIHSAREKARHEERLLLANNSLTSTQQELSEKMSKLTKQGNELHRATQEAKRNLARAEETELELTDQKEVTKKQDEELRRLKNELAEVTHQASEHKKKWLGFEVEIDGLREREAMLNQQVEAQDQILSESRQGFASERDRHTDTTRQLTSARNQIESMKADIAQQKKYEADLNKRIEDLGKTINDCRDESDTLHQRNSHLKGEMAEKEAQLKMATMSMETLTKQNQDQSKAIGEKEDRIAQLRNELDKANTQVKNLRNELSDVQLSGRDSNTQLVSLQAKHKETMHQLSEHSKAAAQLKAELERIKAVNLTMNEDLKRYDQKVQQQNQGIHKLQDENKEKTNEIRGLHMRVNDLESDISAHKQRNQHSLEEVAVKEEELVVHRVELEALKDKYKQKQDDIDRLTKQVNSLSNRLQSSQEDVGRLTLALHSSEDSRESEAKEKEKIVSSIQTWIAEQKINGEKSTKKMRAQSESIQELTKEKEALQDELSLVKKDNSRLQKDLEQKRVDYDNMKSLEQHMNSQQQMIHQLNRQRELIESDHENETKTVKDTVNDMHSRLMTNIEIMEGLNQKIIVLQEENSKFRREMEREMESRRSLQMQLEAKEQLVHSLQAAAAASGDTSRLSPIRPFTPDPSLSHLTTKHVLDEMGETDLQAIDKSYWITKVGQLSQQLQQSTEFWSEKVRELKGQPSPPPPAAASASENNPQRSRPQTPSQRPQTPSQHPQTPNQRPQTPAQQAT